MAKNKIRGFIGVKSNDGHDAPILVVADALKKGGVEIILGGYDLTVDKFANAIVQEGVHFAGISSYNGGHVPFFKSVRDELKRRGYPHIHIIGGGGATVTPREIEALEREEGIDKIFKSGEARKVAPYVNDRYDFPVVPDNPENFLDGVRKGDALAISMALNLAEEKARLESAVEAMKTGLDLPGDLERGRELLDRPVEKGGLTGREALERIERYAVCLAKLEAPPDGPPPGVYGITGRGGSGKSTLTDEIIFRFFNDRRTAGRKAAILAVDPSSHSSGGALLADRIAFMYATDKNWIDTSRIYIRSVASRGYGGGVARALPDMIKILRAARHEIFIESYGIGQPDSGMVRLADRVVFVATPDIGGASQIEKEEMLNMPGVYVALNKSELRGAKHVGELIGGKIGGERLFFTTAIEHKNPGVDALYRALTAHYG